MVNDFGLPVLSEFIFSTLLRTDQVANVLRSECNEIRCLLKSWNAKVTIADIADTKVKDDCTSGKEEDKSDGMIKEINEKLLQAQLLREKLSSSIVQEKRHRSFGKLRDMHKPITRNLPIKEKQRESKNKLTKYTITDIGKSRGIMIIRGNDQLGEGTSKNISSKDVTRYNKEKKQKDFVKANILSVKKTEEVGKQISDVKINLSPKITNTEESNLFGSRHTKNTDNNFCDKAFCADLNTNEKSSDSWMNKKRIKYVFDDSDSIYHQGRIHKCIDIVEALDAFTIPNEIIKTLKVFHAYLHSRKDINEEISRGTAVNIFLSEFEKMNKKSQKDRDRNPYPNPDRDRDQDQDQAVPRADITTVALQFMSLFKSSLCTDNNQINYTNKFSEAECAWKRCNVQKFDIQDLSKSKIIPMDLPRGWKSNGIWNQTFIPTIKGATRAYCIRYSSDDQLWSFFEATQKLQQAEYLKSLLKLLLQHVISRLKTHPEKNSAEYVQAYKMVILLCQGLNPKIPVLVESDE